MPRLNRASVHLGKLSALQGLTYHEGRGPGANSSWAQAISVKNHYPGGMGTVSV